MARSSITALRQAFTVQRQATDDLSRKALVATARQVNASILREQTARAGIAPSVEAYANTPGNANLDSVKLPGPIVHLYDYRPEIAKVGLEALRAASPRQSGAYQNNHRVLLNGNEVEALPASLKATDEIILVNPVPYARRIEIGKTKSGRDFVLQVPNRIYERVAKTKLSPLYRNVASVSFGYIELGGAYTIKGGLGSHYVVGLNGKGRKRLRKRRQKKGEAVRAPAIFIRSLPAGAAV